MYCTASLPLLAAGLIAVAAAAPAPAQHHVSQAGSTTITQTGPSFTDPDRLVETFMAEDRFALDEAMAILEPALDSARAALERANRKLTRAERNAERALAVLADTKAAARSAQFILDVSVETLQSALDSLAELKSLPASQEVLSDIGALEFEISILEPNLTGAQSDLDRAGRELQTAKANRMSRQKALIEAQTASDSALAYADTVQREIVATRQAFDEERVAVETLVAALSLDQLIALNRSLTDAVSEGLRLHLNADQLARVLEDDFNAHQIAVLTKAFVAEAKFHRLAEETGDPAFFAKAEREKARYLAKIDAGYSNPEDGFGSDGLVMPASRTESR